MKKSYSFLKDELAIAEIRKHKWIESEKLGYEIGFATAAVDWVHHFGESWKTYRLKMNQAQDLLTEKRRHRRFTLRVPVQISIDNAHIDCHTDDISLMGMSCTIPARPLAEKTKVKIRFEDQRRQQLISSFEFESRVARVVDAKNKGVQTGYNIFLPFNEEIRDYLRFNSTVFSN